MAIRVTVWNEFRHEKTNKAVQAVYPDGMHKTIAAALSKSSDLAVKTATLDEPEHGLTQAVVDATDVMLWWGHTAHGEVKDDIVTRVWEAVLQGMGLIVLHSGHFSKIFRRAMGTSGSLCWREAGEREVLWLTKPGHPIVAGINEPCIILPQTEMYGEPFDIPEPEETVFISSFAGGEVFRSGCTWQRGSGKIFYFRPGHETYPIFHNPIVQKILTNACHWAARPGGRVPLGCPNRPMGWFEKK